MAKHQSTYDKITAGIIAAVERNPGAPKMPWHTAAGHTLLAPANAVTKAHYRGINILLLWIAAAERGFPSSHWGSYKQWASVGGQVRGGETATRIVFFKEFDVDPTSNPAGGPTDNPKDDGKRMTARTYSVFNAAQVDGVVTPDVVSEPDHGPLARHAAFDAFVAATGAEIVWMGHSAYYRPSTDTITMPAAHLFHGTATMERSESAMAVLAHELTHWSGAKHRLDRDFSKRFKTLEIAGEELVAELGAAFLCAQLGISAEPRLDHAQYVAHWMTLMKADSRAIFTAAAAASKAADYLLGFLQAPPWEELASPTDATADFQPAA